MQYVFGSAIYNGKPTDILKTVGETHTSLSGSVETVRKYSDNIITDVFVVDDHYLSKEDIEGNCYDWYRISNHYRMMDKFTPGKVELENKIEENSEAEFDLADMIDENNNSIFDLAEYAGGLEERIAELEGRE